MNTGSRLHQTLKNQTMEVEIRNNKEVERRTVTMEMRAAKDSRTIEGYAAVFGQPADMGWYDEEIAPGFFDEADMSDIVALFNHDPNWVLGRTTSGTLSVRIDPGGFGYRLDSPNTNQGNDVLEMIRRGDIYQSSFAFTILKESWIEEKGMKPKRILEKADTIYDVSPVTYPAYTQTSVVARKRQEIMEKPPVKTAGDPQYPQLLADFFTLKSTTL